MSVTSPPEADTFNRASFMWYMGLKRAIFSRLLGNSDVGKNEPPSISRGTPNAATRAFTSSVRRASCVPNMNPKPT